MKLSDPTGPLQLGGDFPRLTTAFSRRVVGWSMANHLRTRLVLDALDMALWQRRPDGVIHHSVQGSQYTSIAFGKRCQDAGVRPSTGSVGDCYDNLWMPPAAR